MGVIANQMALDLLFKFNQRMKDKKEEKKQKEASEAKKEEKKQKEASEAKKEEQQ